MLAAIQNFDERYIVRLLPKEVSDRRAIKHSGSMNASGFYYGNSCSLKRQCRLCIILRTLILWCLQTTRPMQHSSVVTGSVLLGPNKRNICLHTLMIGKFTTNLILHSNEPYLSKELLSNFHFSDCIYYVFIHGLKNSQKHLVLNEQTEPHEDTAPQLSFEWSTSLTGSLFFPSPLGPGGGKKRDHGNEVVEWLLSRVLNHL